MRASLHPPNRRVSAPAEPDAASSRAGSRKRRGSQPPPSQRDSRAHDDEVHDAQESEEADSKTAGRAKTKKRKGTRKRPWLTAWFRRLQLMTGIVVVVAASVLVAWGLHRYLRSSPRFAVKWVHVDGASRRQPAQLSKRAGILVGNNIFALDEELAEAQLLADPWIEHAEVRKELPNKVFIKVREHEARALLSVAGKLYLVDSSGAIFKELGVREPHDLPVVTGIDSERLVHDREAVELSIRRVLELAGDLEEARIAKRYPLQEFNIQADGSVSVVVGSDAISLQFGLPPHRAKIAKAQRILAELRHRRVKPLVIFLDNRAHPERVVVRMR